MIEPWIQDLVGVPYVAGGDSPETGFDCYGLMRYVLKRARGVELPPSHLWTLKVFESGSLEQPYWRLFKLGTEPLQVYDTLFMQTGSLAVVDHAGVMVSREDLIHCGSKIGGVVIPRAAAWFGTVRWVGRTA